MKNYYEILKVSKEATQQEIRKAYINLAQKLHPDKVKPEEREKANKIFIQIKTAYNTLSDEKKKKEYDRDLEKKNKISLFDFGNVFENRTPKITKETIEISLEEIVSGGVREIRGQKVRFNKNLADGDIIRTSATEKDKEILEILIKEKKHPLLKRNAKNDLEIKIPVSLKTAVMGGPIEIYTLQGIKKVKLEPGASHGDKFKLEGFGMTPKNNLIVEIEVEMPKKLKAYQLELFEKFCESLGNEKGKNEKKYFEKINLIEKGE